MNSPFFSIIIPIFNAATDNRLQRCIKSILSQSFVDYECLMINDGSTDESEIICNEMKKVDKRFKLISKNNEGVSIARNTGINYAHGKYIVFIDADDTVDANYLQNYHCIINNTYPDLIIIGHKLLKLPDQVIYQSNYENEFSKIGNELILKLYKKNALSYVWDKCYKKEIILGNNIFFDKKISYAEDVIFNIDYLNKIKSLEISKCCYYNYYTYPNSSSSVFSIKILEDFIYSNQYHDKLVYLNNQQKKIIITQRNYDTFTSIMIMNLSNNLSYRMLLRKIASCDWDEIKNTKTVCYMDRFFISHKLFCLFVLENVLKEKCKNIIRKMVRGKRAC